MTTSSLRPLLGRLMAGAILAGASLGPVGLHAQEGGYRIGAGDILTITAFGENGLSGQYAVSPEGVISYPILGEVKVAGRATADVAGDLQQRLAEHLPGISVTAAIAQYAPVFVIGDVENPGRYEYRPGMIALELMALGGGLVRSPEARDSAQIQIIGARQEYVDLELQIFALETTRARLTAERDDVDFKAPDLRSSNAANRVVEQTIIEGEVGLFNARRSELESQDRALAAQEVSFSDEIASIEQSIKLHAEEIDLINQDVASMAQLVERGLTAKSNLREAERRLSATRRDALELGSYLARAKQNLLAIRQRRAGLVETRHSEAAAQLQAIDLELPRKRARQQAILETMAELALVDGAAATQRSSMRVSYTILRAQDGEYHEISAGEQDTLRPGDLLRAVLSVPEATGVANVN